MIVKTANGQKVSIVRVNTRYGDRHFHALINNRCIGVDEVRRDLVSWVRRQRRDSDGRSLRS